LHAVSSDLLFKSPVTSFRTITEVPYQQADKKGGYNIQTVITDISYSIVLAWRSVDKVGLREKDRERRKCKKNGKNA
jgi:hypothetical protein